MNVTSLSTGQELTENEEKVVKLIEAFKIATQSLLPSYSDVKIIESLLQDFIKNASTTDNSESNS